MSLLLSAKVCGLQPAPRKPERRDNQRAGQSAALLALPHAPHHAVAYPRLGVVWCGAVLVEHVVVEISAAVAVFLPPLAYAFWYDKAMWKLPPLIDSTNMLTCAEDLGMIPACVPAVMQQLEILSLEIQRMPKDPGSTFGDTWIWRSTSIQKS